MNQVVIIIGMMGIGVASYIAESVLNGAGKVDDAKNVSLLGKCIIGGTALSMGLVPLVKTLYTLAGK